MKESGKSRHYRPTWCFSCMNISVVRTTADAPNKDPAIARLAETEPKSLKEISSRLHNHSRVELDILRHVGPHVLGRVRVLCRDISGGAHSRGEAGVEPVEHLGLHVASQVQVDAAVVVES
ncbi:hypothetical protein Naga_100577g5 [Nannochloropsis gaditana]|uniref:Uncharacterized protein n=1 Tax=Nannochloropsis gaditana TaxID=72520 RepID=W7TJL2_9STRA|nr:hypothetical protein Naga_100577g5 [Nannochloropsis gaditana]